MAEITESRLAMYEGIVALAWADHELDVAEKEKLHELINQNPHFTDEQRAKLHLDVDNHAMLADIWPRITEKRDKAHLLNIASVVFLKDGKYCADEKELYDTFLAKHLATLDSESMMSEIREMAIAMRDKLELEEAEMEEYARQFSLVERIKRFFTGLLPD